MSLLCFFPSYYAFKKFSRIYQLWWRKCHYACILRHKKFYRWRQWACYFTRFLGLTVFSSVLTVPWLLRLPARRDSHDLALLCEVRKPGQTCSIMKTSISWLGSWSPLARFWSCRQYYYQNEARYRATARFSSKLLLGPAVDNSPRGALYVHYSCKTARLFPNYVLHFCGPIFPLIMLAYSRNYMLNAWCVRQSPPTS